MTSRTHPANTSARTVWSASIVALLLIVPLASCLVDGSASGRCGPGQEYDDEQQSCVCEPGHVPEEGICIPCEEGRVVVGNTCECPEGMTEEDGACVPIPAGLGVECSAGEPCVDDEFAYCAPDSDGTDYCTVPSCAEDADCPSEYHCATWESPAFCQRPPTGLLESCSSQDDCAGYEASYCELLRANVCLVSGCDPTDDRCPRGQSCCDLTSLGFPEICIPDTSTCPAP